MEARKIQLVQESWVLVTPNAEAVAKIFYNRLFELDPGLRPMFTTDIKVQGKKLVDMITVAVNGLTRLDELAPAVQALGKRHVGYGVRDEHYDTVGTALLWTLEQGLGDHFTNEVYEAWAEVYTTLATVMKEAAREGVEAPVAP